MKKRIIAWVILAVVLVAIVPAWAAPAGEVEVKLAQTIAGFLGKQMES